MFQPPVIISCTTDKDLWGQNILFLIKIC